MKRIDALILAVVTAGVVAACGGKTSTPTQPTNTGGGGTACTPPANTPPVIVSVTAQGTRKNEPADFADVGESIPVVAVVQDAETPVSQLQLTWATTAGQISGSGTNVTWTAPAEGTVGTPIDVTITLTVVENYGCAGQAAQFKNTVSATHTISLHDSVKEVGDMARRFLLDFSDSNIDVATVMQDFEQGCYGTADETQQVTANRQKFTIVRSNIGAATVTEPFGNSFCPIPGRVQRGDACSSTPSHWESTQLNNGHLQIADGVDWVAAYYRPASKAWKLCDSQFIGTCTDANTGKACSDAALQGMVPGRFQREIPIGQ